MGALGDVAVSSGIKVLQKQMEETNKKIDYANESLDAMVGLLEKLVNR